MGRPKKTFKVGKIRVNTSLTVNKTEDSKRSECGEKIHNVPIHICFCIINTYPRINTAKCKMCHTIIAMIIKHNHCSNPN